MKRTRRSLLASLAIVAGAGCIESDTGPSANSETTTVATTTEAPSTPSSNGTTEPESSSDTTATGDVTVSDVSVTPGVVARDSPDTIDVYGERDEQYVLVRLAVERSPTPETDAFALQTDERTYTVDSSVGGMGGELWDLGEPYENGSSGWIAFVLPKPIETGDAKFTWPGGTHPLTEDHVAAVGRPPTSFEVQEFSAPESIRTDEDADLTLTVENTGDVHGTWVGALNRSGPSVAYIPEVAISMDVEAGETATWEYTNTPDDRFGTMEGSMDFKLRWRDGSLFRTVDVTSA